MFMSMYDVGMALYEELVISHAVRAGALYALYYNDPAGIQNVITNSMPSSWTDASITVTIPSSCLCMSASGISAAISCANSCTNGAVMEKLEMVSVSRPFSPLILTAITQISASDVIRYH